MSQTFISYEMVPGDKQEFVVKVGKTFLVDWSISVLDTISNKIKVIRITEMVEGKVQDEIKYQIERMKSELIKERQKKSE